MFSARTVPLSADDNGDGNSDATPTGTARQEIKFFWLGDSGNKDVKLAVDGVGSAEITKSTKFDVVEPSWAGTGTEGTPTIVKLKDGTALLALYGVPGIEGGKVGIRFTATVSTPDGFENGQFGFFQTWISHDRNTIVLPSGRSVTLKTRHEGETGADGQIPYLGQSWAADGSEHSAQDTPKHWLRKEDTSTTLDGHWITTLMFKPVGDAVWIPLAKLDWTTQITATNDGKGPNWRVQSNSQTINGVAGPSSSSFVREMNEPVWSVVLTPDDRMVLAD